MDILVKEKIDDLIDYLKQKKYNQNIIDLVYKSFEFAYKFHFHQKRKSGEPYIIHPIATVKILASWDMDEHTLIAGMLHDVLEDTDCSEDHMEEVFGEEVTKLVKFVTKVSEYSKTHRKKLDVKRKEEENYSIQVFMSMTQDIRAMIIKIADRYHNMQTIKHLQNEKAMRIASETLDIYANISGRLGMYRVKTELLDMAFEILDPENFKNVSESINKLIESNKAVWNNVLIRIKNIMSANNIDASYEYRIKGKYSTFKKMQKGYELKDVHDIYAIRIILNDVYLCYQTLGLIHMNFIYIINTFKDYISAPKWNLYQSLHTTIAYEDILSEIQIRTKKMNNFANNGLAAHWKYKEANVNKTDILSTVNNLLLRDYLNDNKSIKEITTGTIFDVLSLNNNKWITVSDGSTLLDVAYKIDVDNFFNIISIYKNGERSHFDTHVESGDTIKVAYSKNVDTVRVNWITSVNNDAIKKLIINHLKKKELNKQITTEQFWRNASFHLDNKIITQDHAIKRLQKELEFKNINEFLDNVSDVGLEQEVLYEFFAENKQVFKEALNKIQNQARKWLSKHSYFSGLENLYFTEFEISGCCSKAPGMDCVAKVVKNKVEIHRSDCTKIKNTRAKTIVLEWSNQKLNARPRYFKINALLKGIWSESVGNNICTSLIKSKVNISKVDIIKNKTNRTYETFIKIYVKNFEHLQKVMLELESKNVITEWRIV